MKNWPDKLWRWQSTFPAQAGPQYAANADPSSFTENHIPLIMDWFSGFDTPDPMHPISTSTSSMPSSGTSTSTRSGGPTPIR